MYNAKYEVKLNHTSTLNHYPTPRKLFRKRKYTAKEIIGFVVFYAIPCVLLAWFFLSWVNTVNNNISTFEYAWWNMFRLFEAIRK